MSDSIELLQNDQCDRSDSGNSESSLLLANADQHVLDMSVKSRNTLEEEATNVSHICFIETETFDFDLPDTSGISFDKNSSAQDEDDKGYVFYGPAGFKEKCAQSVASFSTEENEPLVPLNPCQLSELVREANALVVNLSSATSTKTSKIVPRDDLFHAEQLNLDNSVLSKDTVDSFLSNVEESCVKRKINSERKENLNITEIAKDDSILCSSYVPRDVMTHMPADVEIKKNSVFAMENKKSLARQYSRSSTFYSSDTSDTSHLVSLPRDNRKSLKVSLQKEFKNNQGPITLPKLQQPAAQSMKPEKAEAGELLIESSNKPLPWSKLETSSSVSTSFLPSKQKPVGSTSSPAISTSASVVADIPETMSEPVSHALPAIPVSEVKGKGMLAALKYHLMKKSGLQRWGSMPSNILDGYKKFDHSNMFASCSTTEAFKDMSALAVVSPKAECNVESRNMSASSSTASTKGPPESSSTVDRAALQSSSSDTHSQLNPKKQTTNASIFRKKKLSKSSPLQKKP